MPPYKLLTQLHYFIYLKTFFDNEILDESIKNHLSRKLTVSMRNPRLALFSHLT